MLDQGPCSSVTSTACPAYLRAPKLLSLLTHGRELLALVDEGAALMGGFALIWDMGLLARMFLCPGVPSCRLTASLWPHVCSLRSEDCNVVAVSDGVIHSRISREAGRF